MTNRGDALRLAGLIAAVVAISIGHYVTDPVHANAHVLYQRLYHLPILLGAVWFGLRGGLGLAVLTAVLYLPHIVLHWGHEPLYRSAQLAEIVLFLVFGALAGILIDRLRKERERHRSTAEELARAYEQLQATFERLRLEDRLAALGALSVGMAHEIRNPLGAIAGAIEILDASVPQDDERHEFVGILKKEIARLSTLVSRQLDLVRPSPTERGPCRVDDVVRTVVELARKQAENQGVEVDVEIAPDLPAVHADEQRIQQAVLNLVVNAVQAMPDGGRLAIRVEADAECVRVEVRDTGSGLTEEAAARAFEPFFTTKENGTGLGLSIAFQIAAEHGGDLRARNGAGRGAVFTLEIPR